MVKPKTSEETIWPANEAQNSAAKTERELKRRTIDVRRKAWLRNLSRRDPNIIFPTRLATPITLRRRLVFPADIPNFCSALSVMKE